MARQAHGILDGYRGAIGPVIGYQWRGRWCLRAKPRYVKNPRTEAQQEHRMLFRDMVRLASHLTPILRRGLRAASLEEGMTEGNLFVRMNKDLFASSGVEYPELQISRGPVAPVEFTKATLGDDMVLRCEFERNPYHLRTDVNDEVWLYVYCPAEGTGAMAAPVPRRQKKIEMALPDEWAGEELHCYAFVKDYAGRTSDTLYVSALLNEEPPVEVPTDGAAPQGSGLPSGGYEAPLAATSRPVEAQGLQPPRGPQSAT